MSTEVNFGRIVESTNVHYKPRVLMKKRINKRMEVVCPEGFGKDLAFICFIIFYFPF